MQIPTVSPSPGAQRVSLKGAVILALLGLSACDARPSAVALTLQKFEVAVPGAQFPTRTALQLKATAFYSDGTKVNVTEQTEWSSLDSTVAVIGKTGIAQLDGVGQARFDALFEGRRVPVNIEVTAATLASLTLTAVDASPLAGGDTRAFRARASFSDGTWLDVTERTTWIADGTSLSSLEPGVVLGRREGLGVVRAIYFSQQATLTVPVTSPRFVSLSIAAPFTPMPLLQSRQLVVNARFSDGSLRDVTTASAWSSSNANVLDVSPTGVVFARLTGLARITARWNEAMASRELIVDPRQHVGLHFVTDELSLALGRSGEVELVADFDDASTLVVTSAAQWTSSDPSVAGVDSEGHVTTNSVGAAVITATFGDHLATYGVIVGAPVLVELQTTLNGGRLGIGQTANFMVSGTFTDGATINLSSAITLRHGPQVSSVVDDDRVKLAGAQLGVADVEIEAGGQVQRVSFEVSSAQVVRLEVLEHPSRTWISPELTIEGPARFHASAEYSDGVILDVTELCTWWIDDSTRASISDWPGYRGQAELWLGGLTTVRASMFGVDSALSWDFPARP